MQTTMYLRFAAMIVTGMVVMYWVMFVGSWEWSHVRWSQSRMFMALTMGGTMGLVMLAWMLNMYRNTMANIVVVVLSLLLLAVGIVLDRSQTTVDDTAFMKAMIPHHSLAITRSERFNVADVRVCELAVAISEAQRREILEMDWLIDDIRQNGPPQPLTKQTHDPSLISTRPQPGNAPRIDSCALATAPSTVTAPHPTRATAGLSRTRRV